MRKMSDEWPEKHIFLEIWQKIWANTYMIAHCQLFVQNK